MPCYIDHNPTWQCTFMNWSVMDFSGIHRSAAISSLLLNETSIFALSLLTTHCWDWKPWLPQPFSIWANSPDYKSIASIWAKLLKLLTTNWLSTLLTIVLKRTVLLLDDARSLGSTSEKISSSLMGDWSSFVLQKQQCLVLLPAAVAILLLYMHIWKN